MLNLSSFVIFSYVIEQKISALRKTFKKSINKMIRPLWNVNTSMKSCSTLGWNQTQVGKAYLSLFPNDLHFTKSCGLQEAIVDNFEAGMTTMNFHNCIHLDEKDKNEITHCSFSPPPTWEDYQSKKSKLCAFSTGRVIIDLSGEPQRISFLPEQIYHGTSEPWNTPSLPEVLTGSKSSVSILDKRQEILKFISNSMLAWGNWNHANCQSRRATEWNKCAEGGSEEEGNKRRYDLVNCIWSEKNKNKRRRKGYQRKKQKKA